MGNALTGDYLSYAQACGEAPIHPRGWVAGEDFDPSDEDEMATVRAVWADERWTAQQAKIDQLEAEVASLRARLGESADDDGEYSAEEIAADMHCYVDPSEL